MNNIISLLDYNLLLSFDDYILNTNNNNWQAKMELVYIDNKNINIYKNFFMINEEISQIFAKNFNLDYEYNTYLSHMNGDIIIISKDPQYSILFGKINSMDYSFDIKYILDFDKNNKLENELKKLMHNEIKEYIKNNTLFNENEQNFSSPIFDNNEIIGYFYKYYSNRQCSKNSNFYFNFLKQLIFIFIIKIFQRKLKKQKEKKKNTI
jgi:hypothetical protein